MELKILHPSPSISFYLVPMKRQVELLDSQDTMRASDYSRQEHGRAGQRHEGSTKSANRFSAGKTRIPQRIFGG